MKTNINECCGSGDCFATPMNTVGMGNPSCDSGDAIVFTLQANSETQNKKKKRKKLKSLKQHISDIKPLNKYITEK